MNIALGPERVARCIEEAGFGFMFAQTFHPAMRFAAGPRREIGIRTIFNTLGPLMNPAGVTAQVFGMADPSLAETVGAVPPHPGRRTCPACARADGLDEISLAAPTDVWDLEDGEVSTYTVTPDDFGLGSVDIASLRVGSAAESAATVQRRARRRDQAPPATWSWPTAPGRWSPPTGPARSGTASPWPPSP